VDVVKDASGVVRELRCEYDKATLGGKPTSDGRKVKGVVHWVSATKCLEAEVRIYGRLFSVANPEDVAEGADWKSNLNPESLRVLRGAKLEWSLREARPDVRYQFERVGYFCVDSRDSREGAPVFNLTVDLPSGH
jgi:glutaminyl-tRNA synthetase